MKFPSRKHYGLAAGLVVLVALAYVAARIFVFSQLQRKVVTRLDQFRREGGTARYKTFETDPWHSRAVMTGLEIAVHKMDSGSVHITAPRIEIDGIDLLSLFRQELKVKRIRLYRPVLQVPENFKRKQHGATPSARVPGLTTGILQVDSGKVEVLDSASHQVSISARLNLRAHHLKRGLSKEGIPEWSVREILISGMNAAFLQKFYHVSVKDVKYSQPGELIVDSVKITPMFDRKEFARRAGKQVDQLTAVVPRLRITGLEVDSHRPSYAARRAEVQFRMEAFRDKRVERKKRKPTRLPVAYLQGLTAGIQIDTLVVSDSYASYEEIRKDGEVPGKVFFDNLQVVAANISNTSSRECTLTAKSRFMDAGELKVDFLFPPDPKKPGVVKGLLSNFSMAKMNSVLVPGAHVEIESGEMHEMKFEFKYNDYRSDGQVELFYSNLKVHSLKKNPARTVNKLVSFLLNIFVRNDMDRSDSKDTRTGVIMLYRDPQRGVLNYWLRSVIAGIKSQFRVDKIKEMKSVKKGR
jgi:hypothetical protein